MYCIFISHNISIWSINTSCTDELIINKLTYAVILQCLTVVFFRRAELRHVHVDRMCRYHLCFKRMGGFFSSLGNLPLQPIRNFTSSIILVMFYCPCYYCVVYAHTLCIRGIRCEHAVLVIYPCTHYGNSVFPPQGYFLFISLPLNRFTRLGD